MENRPARPARHPKLVEETVKIAVYISVTVTPEQAAALARDYGFCEYEGEGVPVADLRKFVKGYFNEYAQGSPASPLWEATCR